MRSSITLVAAALLLASPLNAAPAGNAPLPSDSNSSGLAKRDFLETLFNNVAQCIREECSEFTDQDEKIKCANERCTFEKIFKGNQGGQ